MNTTDTYQNWIDRVVGGRDAKPLDPGEVVKSSAGQPFGSIDFVKVEKKNFNAEVGKKGSLYIYHIYPGKKYMGIIAAFHAKLSDAFIEVFKNPEQVAADWVEEMGSFAIKVTGYADTVWGDELALRALDVLDTSLGE